MHASSSSGGSSAEVSEPVAAIVLVGGRARRMGGAAKHLLELAGSTPWRRTLAALSDHGITPVVAVGPTPGETVPAPGAKGTGTVTWVREQPPFGGPVAALAAALALPELARVEEFLLLAGDLARPEAVVARLAGPQPPLSEAAIRDRGAAGAAPEGTGARPPEGSADAVVFRADDRPQWLAGRYRVAAVREALTALGEVEGASCRALLGDLPIRWIPDEDGITADIDTPDDLARARADAAGSAARSEEPS